MKNFIRTYTEVAPSVLDVAVDQIRTVTMTREQYLALGGMAVSKKGRGNPRNNLPLEPYQTRTSIGEISNPNELFDALESKESKDI